MNINYVYIVIKYDCSGDWGLEPEILSCFDTYDKASHFCQERYTSDKTPMSLGIRRFDYA